MTPGLMAMRRRWHEYWYFMVSTSELFTTLKLHKIILISILNARHALNELALRDIIALKSQTGPGIKILD